MKVISENNVNKNDIKNFINYSHSSLKFMLILLLAAFILFLIFCVIINNTGNNFGYGLAGIIWCFVVYTYSFIINPSVAYSSFKKKYTKEAVIKFEFLKQNLSISITSPNGKWDIRKNYGDLFKAIETEDYFFFYVKRNEAYIMKKEGIKQGDPKDITDMLTGEMGNKFIRKVKSYDKV